MNTIYGQILSGVLGWKFIGQFPDLSKSVVIFAPHTSYWDGLIGKLYFKEIGINHRFLSKEELFIFPMNIFMKWYGSIPVKHNTKYVFQVADIYDSFDELHIILSPEGTRKKTSNWKKGFYYIAQRANVPVIVGYIDYSKKQIGILDTLYDMKDVDATMSYISHLYKNIHGKYDDCFEIDKNTTEN
jgi:1-acyl-sn-glycerol-3-phosphate acyltransferase